VKMTEESQGYRQRILASIEMLVTRPLIPRKRPSATDFAPVAV